MNRTNRRKRIHSAIRWAQAAAWAVEAKEDEAKVLLHIALLCLSPKETNADSLEPGFHKFMASPLGRRLARLP